MFTVIIANHKHQIHEIGDFVSTAYFNMTLSRIGLRRAKPYTLVKKKTD